MTLKAALHAALSVPDTLVVALSGGIDSLTLSAAAETARNGRDMRLCHAVSPAVPEAATARVKAFAAARNLPIDFVNAGEFDDPNYRNNPLNRCYFCKSNLYGTLARMWPNVAAGTNLDDLSDFRPGLQAASEHGILHPFVTAGMTKDDVRELARRLGLGDLAHLPASPCLASRIETDLPIEPADLALIDAVETRLIEELGEITLRCRRTHQGLSIEIEPETLAGLTPSRLRNLHRLARQNARAHDVEQLSISFKPYQRGSAFLHERTRQGRS